MTTLTTTLPLPYPVTLDLRIPSGLRPRVVSKATTDSGEPSDEPPLEPVVPHEFAEFPFLLYVDGHARTISAQLPPLAKPLPLYGPQDFAAAAGDSMEDHVARALALLAPDVQGTLQTLADGHEMPELPPRVPREIANWRARAILELQGLLPTVDGMIAAMTGPEAIVVRNAWYAGAPLARRGATVTALASQLGLTPDQIDAMFIAAENLHV
jgi:hypothetical protein